MKNDPRIKEYRYLEQLQNYIETAEKRYVRGNPAPFIYPKQLEIHLPSDRNTPCNLACDHCFSTLYKKELGRWETEGLKLLHNLKGAIPYSIFGGAYTEPTASPFLFPYLETVKHYGNHFGVHTNGTYLFDLEKQQRFLTNVHEISTDREDYISVSLDAGCGMSWKDLKHRNKSNFWNILQAIETMAEIREKKNKNSHAIRIMYLVSDKTFGQEQFEFIISFAKMMKVDSLRFSVPYDYYARDFEKVKNYKETTEDRIAEKLELAVKDLISESKEERPYIFYSDPYYVDINRFDFNVCKYGFFQITLGSDGFIYPCSAIAAPTAKHLRISPVSSDLEEFNLQCWQLQNNPVRCKDDCFSHGLRCNRMGLEINEYFNKNGAI